MGMNSVEDLDVFKLAHQQALKIYSVSKTFPREETYSLIDQMRRAAVGEQGISAIRRDRPRIGRGGPLPAASGLRSKLYLDGDLPRIKDRL